ncbi:hypothetical protein F5141DRAFT_1060227 [Pisolithus sp. B1]|nr:hypothetical protein F5141DRAFT_1060227 [Pisolithus sp. B1]
MSKLKMRTTVGPPMEHISCPSPARSQAKHPRKRHQESQGGSRSKAIHWEPYPQLTRDLLAWILQHPADHAVLFNETMDQNVQGKPHSQRKKEINVVITDAIFCEDGQYGALFKSTSKGINPNDPNYRNLHEQVLAEFPFWGECDQLWHGNPTYDARVFNTTPGADRTGDFLTIIKSGGTTAPPACDNPQVQEQGDTVGYPTSSTNANWHPSPNTSMDVSEQEEEEEGEMDEGQEGDWNVVSALEPFPEYGGNHGDFMLVDEQLQAFGDHLPCQHEVYSNKLFLPYLTREF